MNVKHEMHDYTSNNWYHWNINKRLKENFGGHTRKMFNRVTKRDSYTWNITHNTESAAVIVIVIVIYLAFHIHLCRHGISQSISIIISISISIVSVTVYGIYNTWY